MKIDEDENLDLVEEKLEVNVDTNIGGTER